MASSPPLPEELLLKIFGFIDDRHALLDVISTSRLFRRLGEFILYESVTIHAATPALPRWFEFRNTITTHPRFGDCVKTLTMLSPVFSFSPAETDRLRLACDVLHKLPNLKRLSAWCPTVLYSLVPPFALTHLRWKTLASGEDQRPFGAFLESQPSLEFLDIKSTDVKSLNLSEKALPRLRVLIAHGNTPFDILPNRQITHLDIYITGDKSHTRNDKRLRAAFEHVRSLHCSSRSLQHAVSFAVNFPNLEYLSLDFDSSSNRSPLSMATQASNLLVSLSSKRIKYISVASEPLLPRVDDALALFAVFPMLRAVDFENTNLLIPFDPNTYIRYTPESFSFIGNRVAVDAYSWELWWQNRGLESDVDKDASTNADSI